MLIRYNVGLGPRIPVCLLDPCVQLVVRSIENSIPGPQSNLLVLRGLAWQH